MKSFKREIILFSNFKKDETVEKPILHGYLAFHPEEGIEAHSTTLGFRPLEKLLPCPCIYGQFIDGKREKFTLIENEFIPGTATGVSFGFSTTEIGAKSKYLLMGGWLKTATSEPSNIQIRKFCLRTSYMENWFRLNNFYEIQLNNQDNFITYTCIIDNKNLIEIIRKLIYNISYKGRKLKIYPRFSSEEPISPHYFSDGTYMHFHKKDFLCFEVTNGAAFNLGEVLNILEKLRNLFSFLLLQNINIEDTTLFLKKDLFYIEDTDTKLPNEKAIKLLFPQRLYIEFKNREQRNLTFNDLSFPKLKERFGIILSSWLEKYEKIYPFFNLFFETMRNKYLTKENQFLFLIMGLEAFHRRKFPTEQARRTDFEKKLGELDCIKDENFKKLSKEKLKYGYEPTLRTRLKELNDKYKFSQILKIDKNTTKKEINDIVNLRNNLIHQGDKYSHANIKKLISLLIAFSEEILLQETGVKK